MKFNFKATVAACALLASFTTAVSAQTVAVAEEKVTVSEEFTPHFYIQPQVGAAYTLGEASFDNLISPAAALNFGYRFKPAFGLRLGFTGWQAKGSWTYPRHYYKYNYVQASVDAVLSFTNLFMDYNPSRVLDVYGVAGFGAAYGFHNNDVEDLIKLGYAFQKPWFGHRWFYVGRVGLGVDFNLSHRVALNIEVNANILPDRFNSKKGSSADWQYNAFAGVKINFGKGPKKVVETVEEAVVVEEPAPAPQPAPQPVAEPAPVEKPAPAPATLSENIFFRLNSSRILASEQDKIQAMVKFLQEHPNATVTVTGYADKDTGTAAYNRKISRWRAMHVADELSKAGIESIRIKVDYKGDTVQPFAENDKNRVVIAIAE